MRSLAELDEHASRLPVTLVGVLDPYSEIMRAQSAVLFIVFLLPAWYEIPQDKLGSIVILHESNKRMAVRIDRLAHRLGHHARIFVSRGIHHAVEKICKRNPVGVVLRTGIVSGHFFEGEMDFRIFVNYCDGVQPHGQFRKNLINCVGTSIASDF